MSAGTAAILALLIGVVLGYLARRGASFRPARTPAAPPPPTPPDPGPDRGMTHPVLRRTARHASDAAWLAVSGFSSWVSLRPEDGLHVLERGTSADGGVKRVSVLAGDFDLVPTGEAEGD